jgi:hypothetical protein
VRVYRTKIIASLSVLAAVATFFIVPSVLGPKPAGAQANNSLGRAAGQRRPNMAAGERQPHMFAALRQLRAARASLDRAEPDKEGHRVKAIPLVDQAIAEVEAGIRAGRSPRESPAPLRSGR